MCIRDSANCLLAETPNITIMVDEELNIVEFNKAAENVFRITRSEALQKCIYELMDPSDFEFVFTSHQSISDKKVTMKEYGITTLQNLLYVEKDKICLLYTSNSSAQALRQASHSSASSACGLPQGRLSRTVPVLSLIHSEMCIRDSVSAFVAFVLLDVHRNVCVFLFL